MTNQQDTALLPVTQSDRDAAADSPHMVGLRAAIRAGKFDDNPVVQSFARHRIAAEQAKPSASCEVVEQAEGAAQWLDLMADRFEGEWPNTAKHCRLHVNSLRAAITALRANAPEQEEATARALYFDHVDQHGYPNGLLTWDELPEVWSSSCGHGRDYWLSLARAALASGAGDEG